MAFIHQTCEEIWAHNSRGQPACWAACWNRSGCAPTATSTCCGVRVDQSLYRALACTTSPSCPKVSTRQLQVPDVRKEERPTLVWCARLVPYKRPLDAVEAFEIARQQIPDLQLWMIGGDLTWKVQVAATDGVTVFRRVSEQGEGLAMAAARCAHRDQRARRLVSWSPKRPAGTPTQWPTTYPGLSGLDACCRPVRGGARLPDGAGAAGSRRLLKHTA